MAKRKTEPSVKLADFTPGERVDAMLPGDSKIRKRIVKHEPVHKAGISEPIVRTDLK